MRNNGLPPVSTGGIVDHRVTARLAVQKPSQQWPVPISGTSDSRPSVVPELGLDFRKHVVVHNGLVLAGIHVLLVPQFADVRLVGEQGVQPAPIEPLAAHRLPGLRLPRPFGGAAFGQFLDDGRNVPSDRYKSKISRT
jgi:hypothetical protein